MSDSPLIYAMTHHAKELLPVVSPLAIGVVDLHSDGWEIIHRWKNCYSIKRGDTELHFRFAKNPWRIIVLDALRPWGKEIAVLKREIDVFRFIRKVQVL